MNNDPNNPIDPRLNNKTNPSNKSHAKDISEQRAKNSKIVQRVVMINILIFIVGFILIYALNRDAANRAILSMYTSIALTIIYFVTSVIIVIIYLIKGKKPLVLYYISLAFMISTALVFLLGIATCFVSLI